MNFQKGILLFILFINFFQIYKKFVLTTFVCEFLRCINYTFIRVFPALLWHCYDIKQLFITSSKKTIVCKQKFTAFKLSKLHSKTFKQLYFSFNSKHLFFIPKYLYKTFYNFNNHKMFHQNQCNSNSFQRHRFKELLNLVIYVKNTQQIWLSSSTPGSGSKGLRFESKSYQLMRWW